MAKIDTNHALLASSIVSLGVAFWVFYKSFAFNEEEELKVTNEEIKQTPIENKSPQKKDNVASNTESKQHTKDLNTLSKQLSPIQESDEINLLEDATPKNSTNKDENKFVYKVCITGGPYGGKKSFTSKLAEKLKNIGYQVMLVPSCEEYTKEAGINTDVSSESNDLQIKFWVTYIKQMMNLEDYFFQCAVQDQKKAVVLINRGLMDVKSMVSPDLWECILHEEGYSEIFLRDKQYDVVLHMTSSAVGNAEFFNTDDKETIENATEKDFKIQNAWSGHPKLKIVKNTEIFQEKCQTAFNHVCAEIGERTDNNYFKKFLIKLDKIAKFDFKKIFPSYVNYTTFK